MSRNWYPLVITKFLKVILLIQLTASAVLAQESAYFVFFTDKNNSIYTVDKPDEFLSSKSIQRRYRQQIDITEQDIPVNENYLQSLRSQGVQPVLSSKWFNGTIVLASKLKAESLKALPYVRDVDYLAPSGVVSRLETSKSNKRAKISASDSLFQNDILDIGTMHSSGFQGEGMLIGVLDGGFQGVNEIEAFETMRNDGRIHFTYDFVRRSDDVYGNSDHGTKVLSLMAADWPEQSFVGTAPKANYVLLVTENTSSEYRIEEYYWLIGAEKADSIGVDIINASLGYNLFDDPSMDYQPKDMDGSTAVISQAAQLASEKGMLVVTSAGNEGSDVWQTVTAPGDVIDGLAVGSIQYNYRKSIFSSTGPSWDQRVKPDLVALGSGAFLVNGSGKLVTGSGTSFSAPQVAGLAAAFWQAYPNLTVKEVLEAFRSSSDQYRNPDNDLGYGIPSFTALFNFEEAKSRDKMFAVYPNPLIQDGWLRIRVTDPVENPEVKVSLMDSSGKLIQEDSVPVTWNSNEYLLEMSALPSGIYLVNLQTKDKLEKLKIIKI